MTLTPSGPLADLSFLVGSFAGREEVSSTAWAPGGGAAASARGTYDLSGGILILRTDQVRDDGSAFEASNVFAVDPETQDVLLYSFDTFGFPPDPPARGRLEGGVLVLLRHTARGSARTTYVPSSTGFRWNKAFRAPGSEDWQDVVSGELRSAEAPSTDR